MYKVAKDFKTHNRRFKAGAKISAADVEGAAMSFDAYITKGFVTVDEPEKKPSAKKT